MTMTQAPATAPTVQTSPSAPGRLDAIDAARGVALIGMMMINLGTVQIDGWLDRLWTLPFGRASILFVVLAGLGMSLFLTSRRRASGRAAVLVWRAVIFLVGGLALQLLVSDVSVILPMYGVLFIGAILWRRISDRMLLGLTLLMLFAGPLLVLAHQIPGRHKTRMPTLAEAPDAIVHSLFLSGAYPLFVWVVPFLAGMWLGRLDLRERRVHRGMVIGGGAAAVLALVVAQAFATLLGESANQGWPRLLTGAAHGEMPLWLISSIGSATLVVGVALWCWPRVATALRPLADLGRLAFTFYVAHIAVIALIGGRVADRGVAIAVTLGLVLLFTVAASLWVPRLGVGPLERVLRAAWLTTPRGGSR